MVVFAGLDLFGVLDLAGQLGGRMDEGGEALRAEIDFLPLVLQGDQGDLLFRFLTVETSFHGNGPFKININRQDTKNAKNDLWLPRKKRKSSRPWR
jgi:hypothetical protein